MGRSTHSEVCGLSIEIFDRRHRKNPFEDGIDSHQIEARLDVESSSIQPSLGWALNGRTNTMAKAAKKPAAKKAAKKPAAKKKK